MWYYFDLLVHLVLLELPLFPAGASCVGGKTFPRLGQGGESDLQPMGRVIPGSGPPRGGSPPTGTTQPPGISTGVFVCVGGRYWDSQVWLGQTEICFLGQQFVVGGIPLLVLSGVWFLSVVEISLRLGGYRGFLAR